MSADTFEVALGVHDLAVLICGFVSVQVDWLMAHRADVFFMTQAGGLVHGGFPHLLRGTSPHLCCSVQFNVEQ